MRKLTELNGWELMTALAEIAVPVGNLTNDDAVWECFVKCTRKGVRLRQKDGLRFILTTYAELIPLLMSEEHKPDMIRIMSVIEGKPIDETMAMNGVELFKDFITAYREQLQGFFTKHALSELTA